MGACPCEAQDVMPWVFGAFVLGVFMTLFLAGQQVAPLAATASPVNVQVLRDELGRIVQMQRG